MFTPEQRVLFLPIETHQSPERIVKIAGKYTSLVIVDEARLPIGSPQYAHLAAAIGPNSIG
jgi:hypothetical protein